MSHEERNTVVRLICSILTTAYVILRLHTLWAEGAFAGPDALQIWGRMVLWVIPIAIVLTTVLLIVFNILFAIATFDKRPDFTVDERDRLFQIRAMKVTMGVVSGGFILSVAALAFGWQALAVLTLIYFSFALGSFIGDLVKLISYRYQG